jgi:hypothetical protein
MSPEHTHVCQVCCEVLASVKDAKAARRVALRDAIRAAEGEPVHSPDAHITRWNISDQLRRMLRDVG